MEAELEVLRKEMGIIISTSLIKSFGLLEIYFDIKLAILDKKRHLKQIIYSIKE